MSATATLSAPAAPPISSPGLSAADILRLHGRTFHFAGKLLGKQTFEACARLYRFCRLVDDIADQSENPTEARRKLDNILCSLAKRKSDAPRVIDFLDLARDHRLDLQVASELVKGVRSDCGDVRLTSEIELKRYAYRVAGTVGILMCGVLGVRDPRAMAHAIDLGMAMQLTNIARDVAEDARNDRIYLPDESLHSASCFEIANATEAVRPQLTEAVRHWLAEADSYYRSGEAGLAFLPLRSRLAILVAARSYRAIGKLIAARGFATWRGRAVVSTRQKRGIALRVIIDFLRSPQRWRKPRAHNRQLHQHLVGLPLVDAPDTSPSPYENG